MKVSCSLVLPPDVADGHLDEPVTVTVSLEDVTMLDESSITVATTTTTARTIGDLTGPFELEAELEPGRQYAVYAHVHPAGEGTVAPGDLINTTRIPLSGDQTREIQRVEVPLQTVL